MGLFNISIVEKNLIKLSRRKNVLLKVFTISNKNLNCCYDGFILILNCTLNLIKHIWEHKVNQLNYFKIEIQKIQNFSWKFQHYIRVNYEMKSKKYIYIYNFVYVVWW